jgi:ABC-type transport system substrate-binding protein
MLKKRSLWSVGVGALVLMTMLFAACGPSSGGGGNSTGNIVKGGTVINGLYEEPDSLIPYLTNETYSVIVDSALWAPLWYGDNQGVLHSGIADLPTPANGYISSDLKSLTVHLHSGLKWSDGSPLTADDVAFSFNLYGNPDFANTFGFPTTDPKDPIGFAGATKVDDSTVKLSFNNPYGASIAALADGASSIVPAKVFQPLKVADIAKSPERDQRPVQGL